jgi:hypothetical protein
MSDNIVPAVETPKHWALRWAERQGVATVLLALGVYGIWESAPYVLARIEAMQAKQAADLKEAREDYRAELKEERADNRTREEATRKTFNDSIDALTDALQARQP